MKKRITILILPLFLCGLMFCAAVFARGAGVPDATAPDAAASDEQTEAAPDTTGPEATGPEATEPGPAELPAGARCNETGAHQFGPWTFAGNGRHTAACVYCGYEIEAACAYLPAGPYVSEGDGTHSVACVACGGKKTEPCVYTVKTLLSTQTDPGYTMHTCTLCGYSYKDALTNPEQTNSNSRLLGDVDLSGKIESKDARAVLRAAVSLETIKTPMLPYADVNIDGVLSSEDARLALRLSIQLEQPVRHAYTVTETVAATCTATGLLHVTCAYCGFEHDVTAPKTPHVFGEPVVTPATCTEKGLSVSACTVCGLEQKTVLPAAGHTWVTDKTDGQKRCAVCGLVCSGWQQADGKWYYYDEDGEPAVGKKLIEGLVYNFDAKGVSATGKNGSQPKVAVLGDSLVVSLSISGVSMPYDFYGKVSLHVNTMATKSISGSDRTVLDEVKGRGYDVIIVLVGINDLPYDNAAWGELYRTLLRDVKARAPGALVYAHTIFPVNEARAAANGYSVKMSQVNAKNSVIARVAAEEGAGFLNATPVFIDSSGQLPYNAASDGIHFGASYSSIWYNWVAEALAS